VDSEVLRQIRDVGACQVEVTIHRQQQLALLILIVSSGLTLAALVALLALRPAVAVEAKRTSRS